MKNLRICWDNLWDGDATTRTASSAATGFPLSNIKHRWHTRVWRATGDAAEWVKADLGSAKPIKAFILKEHNFTGVATVKIQGNAVDMGAVWIGPTVDITLSIVPGQLVKIWELAEELQWWRVSMADDTNPDTYVKIGRIFLGNFFEPTVNFTRRFLMQLKDPSVKVRSTGGQISVNTKPHYKAFGYEFQDIESPDNETFETIFDAVGQSKPYFIIQDADLPEKTYYVENLTNWDIVHVALDTFYRLNIEVEEMR